MFKFKCGETARDMVTGFTGIIITRSDFISGCNRYLAQPKVDKDGKLPEAAWFDEPTLAREDVLRVTLDKPAHPPG